jgi:hypothetical protein
MTLPGRPNAIVCTIDLRFSEAKVKTRVYASMRGEDNEEEMISNGKLLIA